MQVYIWKKKFEYYAHKIYKKAQQKAIQESGTSFLYPFSGYFSLSELVKTLSSNSSNNTTKGIQIKYQGYDKSNGHYVYNLMYNGSYDGQVFYYPENGGYTILSVGIKQGQSVNGHFANSRLFTPQCGHINADNIDDAIKKAVNCIYKNSY